MNHRDRGALYDAVTLSVGVSSCDDYLGKLPRSRAEAKRLKARHYYTGKPCPHGHDAARYTSTCNCVACHVGHVGAPIRRKAQEKRAEKARQNPDTTPAGRVHLLSTWSPVLIVWTPPAAEARA